MISIKQGNAHKLIFNIRNSDLHPVDNISSAVEISFVIKPVLYTPETIMHNTTALVLKKMTDGSVSLGNYETTIEVDLDPRDTIYIANTTNPNVGKYIVPGIYYYGLEITYVGDQTVEFNLLDQDGDVNNQIEITPSVNGWV
jgi:hypothetical protein